MRRRDIAKALAISAGPVILSREAAAQTCTPPCFPRTNAEVAAGVTPTNYAYAADVFGYDIRRTGAVLNGTTDDVAAINAALSVSNKVWIPDGVTLGVGSSFTLPANCTLILDGLIKPISGYSQYYVCIMSAGSVIRGQGGFDGTNMPFPAGTWTGGGTGIGRAAVGCGIFINGSAGSTVVGCQIRDVSFQNFPSGPVLAFYADDLLITNCVASNCQTFIGGETNGVFHSHQGNRVRMLNNRINTFNWKGHYLGNSIGSSIELCFTNGGAAGMASHYMSGCQDCHIVGGAQTGGFGVKVFQCQRVTVSDFNSYSSSGGGIYMQSVVSGTIEACSVYNPTTYGIIAEEVAGGDLRRITISNNRIEYNPAGSNLDQVGIRCAALDGTNVVDGVAIVANKIYQPFIGIHLPSGSNSVHSNIRIAENDIDGPSNYGILAYVASAIIERNRITSSAAFESIYAACQSGVTGDYLKINGNTSINSNSSANHYAPIASGERVSLNLLEFCDNTAEGGSSLSLSSFNTSAADYVRTLKVCGNSGWNISASTAMNFTFNTTTTVQSAEFLNNKLLNSGGGMKNLVLTNHARVAALLFASTTYNNVAAVSLL